jgi:FlaA1/EpsC-like NDP-sugar epimerase
MMKSDVRVSSASAAFALGLPRTVKRLAALLVDALLCVFATWLSLALRLESLTPMTEGHVLPIVVSVGLALPIFIVFGLYREIFRYSGGRALRVLGRAVAVYSAFYFLAFTLVGVQGVPRSLGLMQPLFLFIAVGVSRWLVRSWLGGRIFRAAQESSWPGVVIYGAGDAGRQLAVALGASVGRRFVAFVDDDSSLWGSSLDGRKVHAPTHLRELVDTQNATELWLAMPTLASSRKRELIESLRSVPVRVRTLPSIADLTSGRVKVSDVRELDVGDLLGRDQVAPDENLLNRDIRNKVVLVTGAGGSIGSELCRQILALKPKCLLLVDQSEFALYNIHSELLKPLTDESGQKLIPLLASVQDERTMRRVFEAWKPNTVYHAAAFKHVPLVEHNPSVGVLNNVWGTWVCARLAQEMNSEKFILVSTDKAVRPTNVMGASKRLAELVLQAMSAASSESVSTCFSMVRFGNVLGSSGSVVPLFRRQIEDGGPITLTHLDITRFFMTIPEAAQLVIQAGAMAQGGDVFVLDMGAPVKIVDLARRMVELSGYSVCDESNPQGDIEIRVTGLRPGEKLYEELLIGNNPLPTQHPKIMRASEVYLEEALLMPQLRALELILHSNDVHLLRELLNELVVDYSPASSSVDWVYLARDS